MQLNAGTLSLFGGGSFGSSNSIQTIDLSPLFTPAQTPPRALNARDFARMTPWDQRVQSTPLSTLARTALTSTRLIETGLGSGVGSGIRDANDRALFTVHNGIRKLQALADFAAKDGLSASDRNRVQERITKGIAELNAHVAGTKLDGALMLAGRRMTNMTTDIADNKSGEYDSKVLVTGASGSIPASFDGDRRFDLTITENGTPTTLSIDLAEMGATPRTLQNVASFINVKLNNSGFESRFTALENKLPKTVASSPERYEQRLRITMAINEQIKFNVASGDGQPALFVAGAQKIDGVIQSGVMKLSDLATSNSATTFDADIIAAVGSTATARAMAKGADGSVFVIADATGKTNGLTPKSSRDVVMMKYDSSGQVVWTRALGSAAPAQGFSIAVGVDGTIAVAGAVDGKADNASTTSGNARDSFVAAFDKEGRDLWYHQQGAAGDDNATNVSVADNGTVFVVGTTTQSYGGAASLGGKDVYLQGFSTTGAVNFTTSIGTSGDDTPAGLVMQNGQPLVVWNQSDGPRMASYDMLTGLELSPPDTLATSGLGSVSSIAVDEAGRLFLAGAATGNSIGDRLVAVDLASNSVLFQSTATNAIRSLSAAGGQVAYATEDMVTIPATGTAPQTIGRGTVIVGLSATTGVQNFSREASVTADGPISIALAPNASASLDALGLPEGELLFGDTNKLADKTGLRPGDNFFIGVNGATMRKIEIAQDETLRTLATKLNRVMLRDGKAEVRTTNGIESLVITPSSGDRIELKAGTGPNDALKQLGLDAAVAIPRPPAAKPGTRSVFDPPPIIALEIPLFGDVSDKSKAKALTDEFDSVLRRIRIGYREVSTDPTQVELRRQTAANANKGKGASAGIAYYQQQAAAGQEALRRLGVFA